MENQSIVEIRQTELGVRHTQPTQFQFAIERSLKNNLVEPAL